MARKISLKKKAGGTKVGNALRTLTGKESKSKPMVFRVGEGLTQAQTAAAYNAIRTPSGVPTTKVGQKLSSGGLPGLARTVDKLARGETITPSGNLQTSGALEAGQFGGSTSPLTRAPLPTGTSKRGLQQALQETFGGAPISTTSGFSSSQSGSSFSSGQSGSQSGLSSNTANYPTSNVINTPTLGVDNTNITLPEETITDYSQYIPSPVEQQVEDASKEKEDSLKDYLASIMDAPSSADAYAKAQRETDILAKQQIVSDLTGQLNGIVARGQANQLSLVGQGRGIPEAIIGGQQAQIGRETAIAALPVQAQLSAAQGNLDSANDNLDTLFKIFSEDQRNEYEYRKEVKKAVYDFASAKEKRALEKLDKMEERTYQETKSLNDERLMYSKMAFANGQSLLGAKIAKLDYKSPTFITDLANLQAQLRDPLLDLQRQKLQQEIIKIQKEVSGTTINPKILNTTQFKAAQAAQNLKLTLNKAIVAVNKYGNFQITNATGKGILDSIKVQLRSEISTALEQGVIMSHEQKSFDRIAGQLQNPFVREEKSLSSLNSLLQSMDGRISLQSAALTNTYQVTQEDIDTLLNITDLSDQEYADMEALI